MRIRYPLFGAVLAFISTAALSATPLASGTTDSTPSIAKHFGSQMAKASGPLLDRGGAVLASSKTYAIFWGPAARFPSDEQRLIPSLLQGFAGSGYLNIANQYFRGASAQTSFVGSLVDGSAPPKSNPNAATLGAEVARVLPAGTTLDPTALYLIYTSNDAAKNYCAYHNQTTVSGVSIQVAYIPNTAGIAGCDAGNLDPTSTVTEGTRSVADSTAHEFMEAITDPKPGSTWTDKSGYEIGDKCELAPEALVPLTGSIWQLQSEWSNAAAGCVFSG